MSRLGGDCHAMTLLTLFWFYSMFLVEQLLEWIFILLIWRRKVLGKFFGILSFLISNDLFVVSFGSKDIFRLTFFQAVLSNYYS